eukprot:GHVU01100790.1.p1 GENE.GHVU01100790.1~~GHVU01100790.1.p1  ORF type:complete len:284 (-),score=53.80 GHVU01100790.1:588-1439(-)
MSYYLQSVMSKNYLKDTPSSGEDSKEQPTPEETEEAEASEEADEAMTADEVEESGTAEEVEEPGTPKEMGDSGTADDVEEPGTADEVEEPGTPEEMGDSGTADDVEEPGTADEVEEPGTANEAEEAGKSDDNKLQSAPTVIPMKRLSSSSAPVYSNAPFKYRRHSTGQLASIPNASLDTNKSTTNLSITSTPIINIIDQGVDTGMRASPSEDSSVLVIRLRLRNLNIAHRRISEARNAEHNLIRRMQLTISDLFDKLIATKDVLNKQFLEKTKSYDKCFLNRC